jgi:hypothetical protein
MNTRADMPFRDRHAAVNAAVAEMRREDVLERPLPWLDWLGSGQAIGEA